MQYSEKIGIMKESEVLRMIAERIREVREANGMTQSELARKLGISRSAVNAWEMGISVPSAQYLIELSRLFRVSADYLLELGSDERIDISFLDENEKKIIYNIVGYFDRCGIIMRRINNMDTASFELLDKLTGNIDDKALKAVFEEMLYMSDEKN